MEGKNHLKGGNTPKAKEHTTSGRQGYTFAVSMVLLATTIIALASYAPAWRKSQEASFAALAPAFESVRMQTWIASDFSSMIGENADIYKNATHTTITMRTTFPFKKEGAPLADLQGYSRSLMRTLSGTGYDAIFTANNFTPNNYTVVFLPDRGRIRYSNNGTYDAAEFFHPSGWNPSSIRLEVNCQKAASGIGSLAIQNPGSQNVNFSVVYTDKSGTFNYSALGDSNSIASFSAAYADGSNLLFRSPAISSGAPASISLTKSPSASLVLPFDKNGSIRDYSRFLNNFTLAGATPPSWRANCRSGGCYYFDGTSSHMTANAVSFGEAAPSFVAASGERMANGGFEAFSGTPDDDAGDGQDDSWTSWSITDSSPPSLYYDARTSPVQSGTYSIKIYSDGGGDSYISQQVSVNASTPYVLSFYTAGDDSISGRYRVLDRNTSNYLQGDGTWGAQVNLDTGVTGTNFARVQNTFTTGASTTSLEIQFAAVPGNAGYFLLDSASLKKSPTLNTGFELYSAGSGIFTGWAVGEGGTFSEGGGDVHSGSYSLQMANDRGDSNSYISNSALSLESGKEYSLEFWAKGNDADGSSARYAIYDVDNGLYLDSAGNWVNNGQAEIFESSATSSTYAKVVKNFRTYGTGVGQAEIQLYVPSQPDATAYVDDLSLTETKDFTISVWMNAPQNNSGNSPPILNQTGNDGFGNTNGVLFSSGAGRNATFTVYSSGNSIASILSIKDGNWHMMTFSVNRTGNYSSYLDGVLIGSGNTESAGIGTINTSLGMYLGGDGVAKYFKGYLDEVRIYQRALSANETLSLYRGHYQDSCTAKLYATYNNASLLSRSLSANYNAELIVREKIPGTLLYLPFDQNISSQEYGAVKDYSQSALGATLGGGSASNSPMWNASGKSGGAYTFDGSNDYLLLDYNPAFNISNRLTISAWVKPRTSSEQYIAGNWWNENSNDPRYYLELFNGNGTRMVFRDNNGALCSAASSGPPLNVWTHIAGTYDSSEGARLYINGVLTGNATNACASATLRSNPFSIGESKDGGKLQFPFSGEIDEVRLLNRSLAAGEIKQLYTDSALRYQGLVPSSRD